LLRFEQKGDKPHKVITYDRNIMRTQDFGFLSEFYITQEDPNKPDNAFSDDLLRANYEAYHLHFRSNDKSYSTSAPPIKRAQREDTTGKVTFFDVESSDIVALRPSSHEPHIQDFHHLTLLNTPGRYTHFGKEGLNGQSENGLLLSKILEH
jgi:hypothetical protein